MDNTTTQSVVADDHAPNTDTQNIDTKQEKPNKQPRLDKHLLAKAKLQKAQEKIKTTDEEIEECISKIESDLTKYKEIEKKFVEQTLKPSHKLLKTTGAAQRLIASAPEPKVDLDDPELKAVQIKPISSGKFKGLMWGVLGGVVAVGGLCYAATRALGMPLLPSKFPDTERITKVLEWTSQQLGQDANAQLGGAAVGLVVLLIIWVIYTLTKTLTASSNLKTAQKIEEDTEFYCNKKSECKTQMTKVREHIAKAMDLIEKYDILLSEQNARLNRALYVEDNDQYDKLHQMTKNDLKSINTLTDSIEKFLETPMAEYGILSQDGVRVMSESLQTADEHIANLYKQ